MKLLTILGARPQFIKAAAISRAIVDKNISNNLSIKEIIVHTGQHYDPKMSEIFFQQLGIPSPDYNLKISNLSHGSMTGRMIEGVEELLAKHLPDCVLLYGDTNSTLAGAIAASKMHIPIAHIEAGLRSNNLAMPEEVNRILTDRVSNLLYCPTASAIKNLVDEGYPFKLANSRQQIIENTGDVMLDVIRHFSPEFKKNKILESLDLKNEDYALCTIHRAENVDTIENLNNILKALKYISSSCQVVLPIHPRTKNKLATSIDSSLFESLLIIDPLSYFEMQALSMNAKVILTDSGGLQKEAYFHQVPCITLREETEWVETVQSGWNILAGSSKDNILNTFAAITKPDQSESLYGTGYASNQIIDSLLKNL
tara:strand:+ start:741 stop:1850 length:1110 start_codon:yes stop_codon:yes gene_type:complete